MLILPELRHIRSGSPANTLAPPGLAERIRFVGNRLEPSLTLRENGRTAEPPPFSTARGTCSVGQRERSAHGPGSAPAERSRGSLWQSTTRTRRDYAGRKGGAPRDHSRTLSAGAARPRRTRAAPTAHVPRPAAWRVRLWRGRRPGQDRRTKIAAPAGSGRWSPHCRRRAAGHTRSGPGGASRGLAGAGRHVPCRPTGPRPCLDRSPPSAAARAAW